MSSIANTFGNGIQDISSISGIIGSDQVEQHVMNFSNGFLYPSLSIASTLGILGTIKVWLKIAMGYERCVNIGLNVDNIGYMLGRKSRSLANIKWIKSQDDGFILKEIDMSVDHPSRLLINELITNKKATRFDIVQNYRQKNKYKSIISILFIILGAFLNSLTYVMVIRDVGYQIIIFVVLLCAPTVVIPIILCLKYASNMNDDSLFDQKISNGFTAFKELDSNGSITVMPNSDIDLNIILMKSIKIRTISVLCSICVLIGYIGSLNGVQNSSNTSTYVWLALQLLISSGRMIIWSTNQKWDDFNESIAWVTENKYYIPNIPNRPNNYKSPSLITAIASYKDMKLMLGLNSIHIIELIKSSCNYTDHDNKMIFIKATAMQKYLLCVHDKNWSIPPTPQTPYCRAQIKNNKLSMQLLIKNICVDDEEQNQGAFTFSLNNDEPIVIMYPTVKYENMFAIVDTSNKKQLTNKNDITALYLDIDDFPYITSENALNILMESQIWSNMIIKRESSSSQKPIKITVQN